MVFFYKRNKLHQQIFWRCSANNVLVLFSLQCSDGAFPTMFFCYSPNSVLVLFSRKCSDVTIPTQFWCYSSKHVRMLLYQKCSFILLTIFWWYYTKLLWCYSTKKCSGVTISNMSCYSANNVLVFSQNVLVLLSL